MANDKTYDRHVNIWINGKEVENNISSIKKEMYNLINAQSRMTIGTKEYIAAGEEIRKIKGIIGEHNESLRQSQSLWAKMKDIVSGSLLKISALAGVIYGAFKAAKGIITSSEGISDRFEALTAGAKEMFWELQHSVATLSFNNLITGLSEAFKRGKQLNEELDRLEDERAYSDYIISSLSRESRALQEVTKNVELDISVRANAAKKREEIEDKIYARSVKLANKVFAIEKDSWEGRNKIGAEEAVKIYEKFDSMNKLTLADLEKRAKKGKELFKGNDALDEANFRNWMRQYGIQHGLLETTIDDYIKYFGLLENGEGKVLPKLFGAFKNFENQVEDAQQRMNTFIKESSGIFKKDGNASISVEGDTSGLEGAITDALNKPKYNADNYANIEAEAKAFLDNEKKTNDERQKDFEETEKAKAEALNKGIEEGWVNVKKDDERQKELLAQKVNDYIDFGARIGETLGQAMADGTITAKDAAKQIILIALDELGSFAQIAIAKATLGSLATADSIATFGVTGGIRAAILVGLIKAAVGAAKGIVSKNLYTGGYSGPGGKYEPVGFVHGGEWVANADMVASPVTGPIIQALEYSRVNSMPGYASGGGPGMNASGSGAAGSSPALINMNPKLEYAIDRMNGFLNILIQRGVTTTFDYIAVDNIRKGMTKLEAIEDKVTM